MADTSHYAVPFVAAIIEREHNGVRQVLVQTRYHADRESIYNGTLEFAAGTLDKHYESVYDAMRREVQEETGMTVTKFIDDDQTEPATPHGKGVDKVFGFRPFCCTQQLQEGRPWVGFIFRCEVEEGTEPRGQEGETKDVRWMDVQEFFEIFTNTPEKIFSLEYPAWQYYFKEVVNS